MAIKRESDLAKALRATFTATAEDVIRDPIAEMCAPFPRSCTLSTSVVFGLDALTLGDIACGMLVKRHNVCNRSQSGSTTAGIAADICTKYTRRCARRAEGA